MFFDLHSSSEILGSSYFTSVKSTNISLFFFACCFNRHSQWHKFLDNISQTSF
eukprot:TRINITY_DN10083_c0_g1_i1.p1 TRINITY_DN10083_c0_g1~~TRINITY_DN10083_c0_g1_i1.p1  ORF type:complete len:53 (-),score=1.15 TRINITY_DN10083_c0_g1_i1:264-422(-)